MVLLSGQLLWPSNSLLLQVSDEENDEISATSFNSLREALTLAVPIRGAGPLHTQPL